MNCNIHIHTFICIAPHIQILSTKILIQLNLHLLTYKNQSKKECEEKINNFIEKTNKLFEGKKSKGSLKADEQESGKNMMKNEFDLSNMKIHELKQLDDYKGIFYSICFSRDGIVDQKVMGICNKRKNRDNLKLILNDVISNEAQEYQSKRNLFACTFFAFCIGEDSVFFQITQFFYGMSIQENNNKIERICWVYILSPFLSLMIVIQHLVVEITLQVYEMLRMDNKKQKDGHSREVM